MRGFGHIDTWVFDMDDTLYDATTYVFPVMGRLMREWMTRELGIPESEVGDVRDALWHKYGATLRGLMAEYNIDGHAFLKETHEIDVSAVPRDEAMVERIRRLPGRKLLFSNTTRFFGERVTKQIGLDGVLDGLFTIEDGGLWPKPHAQAYDAFLSRFGVNPKTACFFEDSAQNLKPAHDLGMTTVWITRGGEESGAMPHVHHRTPSLAAWLEEREKHGA